MGHTGLIGLGIVTVGMANKGLFWKKIVTVG
jgi:hypothetical protein